MDISKLNQRIQIQKAILKQMKLEMLFSSGRIFIPALRLLKPQAERNGRKAIRKNSRQYLLLYVFAKSFQSFLLRITALYFEEKPTTYCKSTLQTMTAKQ